jgi:hypothetical protein
LDSMLNMAEVFVIYLQGEKDNSLKPLDHVPDDLYRFSALKLTISLCLQTFETRVTNGTTRTTIRDAHRLGWVDNHLRGLQFEGDSQKYTVDYKTLIYLSTSLRYSIFNGFANVFQYYSPTLGSASSFSNSISSISVDIFGPQLNDSSNLNRTMAAFQSRVVNITNAMTNVYGRRPQSAVIKSRKS